MIFSMWIICTLRGIAIYGSHPLFHLHIQIKDIKSKCKTFVSIESYIFHDDSAHDDYASNATSIVVPKVHAVLSNVMKTLIHVNSN